MTRESYRRDLAPVDAAEIGDALNIAMGEPLQAAEERPGPSGTGTGKRRIFALDIGTRKVMGLIAQPREGGLEILDVETLEHPTRSMSAGQIEDIAAASKVVRRVIEALAKRSGERPTEAAIAVAGRNLKTTLGKASARRNAETPISEDEINEVVWKALEEAISSASAGRDDGPNRDYSCVGYAVSRLLIDGRSTPLPIGHYGEQIHVEVLASFLPHRVLESQINLLESLGLKASSITLEPIAALQAVVSRDLRRMNLALVDIGAGTSDIALVRDGAVEAFAMVPQAGDAVTERISDAFMLDFLSAEKVKIEFSSALKRKLEEPGLLLDATVDSRDIFHRSVRLGLKELAACVNPVAADLAARIAGAVMEVGGGKTPQGVLLVGGGSWTPGLPEMLAEALEIPRRCVGVSAPGGDCRVDGRSKISWGPEIATPLGIAETAALDQGVGFKKVIVNGRRTFLLAFGGRPTDASAALIAAGLRPKEVFGWPGASMTFTLDGRFRILKTGETKPPRILINGEPAPLDWPIEDGDRIDYKADGGKPRAPVAIEEAVSLRSLAVSVSGRPRAITPRILEDGLPLSPRRPLEDRMRLVIEPVRLKDVLEGEDKASGDWMVNGEKADLERIIYNGDRIERFSRSRSSAAPATDRRGNARMISIFINGRETLVESLGPGNPPILVDALRHIQVGPVPVNRKRLKLRLNGREAPFTSPLHDGALVEVSFE